MNDGAILAAAARAYGIGDSGVENYIVASDVGFNDTPILVFTAGPDEFVLYFSKYRQCPVARTHWVFDDHSKRRLLYDCSE